MLLLLRLGLVGIALGTPAVASADVLIAKEPRETSVSAYAGQLVWSSWNRRSQRYRLRALVNGRVRFLPVRSRAVPFDADLGPGPGGKDTVVYSRCRREPFDSGTATRYLEARGCRLFRYVIGSRREHEVRLPGSSARSDYLPSIWGSRIAFARIRIGALPHILVARVSGAGTPTQVSGGPRGRYDVDPPHAWLGTGPTRLDLRGTMLAFTWQVTLFGCSAGAQDDGDVQLTQLWLVTLSGGRRLVHRGCLGEETNYVSSPSFADAHRILYFQRRNLPEQQANHFRVFDTTTGMMFDQQAPTLVASVAGDATGAYYVRTIPGRGQLPGSRIWRADAPAPAAVPRPPG